MATATGRIRRRARDLELDSTPKSKVTSEMRKEAKAAHMANVVKNSHSREETRARKELYRQMKDAGVSDFEMEAQINGKRIKLKAEIASSMRYVVDIEKLRKLIPEDVFMQCISATQTDVIRYAGQNISDQCVTTQSGSENVSVKLAKD